MVARDVSGSRYLPALRYPWLTPLFDPVLRVAFRERALKARLVAQAAPVPGQRILDLGCGTGTLALLLKQTEPLAQVVGLDGDPKVLAIACAKAAAANADVTWDHGMAYELPYPEASFDTVLSSLVLHHLTHEDKGRALLEVHRILRPGGSFHVADFGTPRNGLMKALSRVGGLLEETADGVGGLLPSMFRNAGLEGVEETAWLNMPLGTVRIWRMFKS